MSVILCKNCNEINNFKAVKCEACKRSFSITFGPKIDECRSIEAEFCSGIYKLEDLESKESISLDCLPLSQDNFPEIKNEPHNECLSEDYLSSKVETNTLNVSNDTQSDNNEISPNQTPLIILKRSIETDKEVFSELKLQTAAELQHNEFCDTDFKLEDFEEEQCTLVCLPINQVHTNSLTKSDDSTNNNIEIPETVLKSKITSTTLREFMNDKETRSEVKSLTSTELYQCIECTKSFKRKASLEAHLRRCHQEQNNCDSPVFSEDSCGSEYVLLEEKVQKNTSKFISKSKKPTISDDEIEDNFPKQRIEKKPKINKIKKNEVYKCTACEKISESYTEHKKHIIIHDPVDKTLTTKTSLKKLKQTPSGFLKCEECDGVFMTEREFNIHQRIHQGVYPCDVCKKILLTPHSLRKHKKRMHKAGTVKKEMQFVCNICNEKYASQRLMLQHRKKYHTEVMKKIEKMTIIDRSGDNTTYVCKVCAKTSKNKYRHEEHLRIHTKEKPYKCEVCEAGISTSNALVHHMRLHENDRPFRCDICNSTYRHKKSLKKHLKLHTGERPFQCRYCEKSFAFNYTRADHERNCHIDDGKIRKTRKRQVKTVKKTGSEDEDFEEIQSRNVNENKSL